MPTRLQQRRKILRVALEQIVRTRRAPTPSARPGCTGLKRPPHRQRFGPGCDWRRRGRPGGHINFAVDAPRTRRLRLPSRPTPIGLQVDCSWSWPKQGTAPRAPQYADQCSRRVLWSAGSLLAVRAGALAYRGWQTSAARAASAAAAALSAPGLTLAVNRLSSDWRGRRRKSVRSIKTERAAEPKADVDAAPRLGACPLLGLSRLPGSPDPQPSDTKRPPAGRPGPSRLDAAARKSLLARARQPGPWSARRAERTRQITAASGRRPPPTRSFCRYPRSCGDERRARAAAACLAVAGTVAIARQTRPTKNDASLFAGPVRAARRDALRPDGVVGHTYATSDVDAAIKAFGLLPVALAPWGGDAGCSVAVPGDVLKKLGGAPVESSRPDSLRTVFRRRTSWRRASASAGPLAGSNC